MADERIEAGAAEADAAPRPLMTPVAPAQRSQVMDALRGFAVLGILAMNIPGFAFREMDFFDPRSPQGGGIDGFDGVVYLINRLVFDLKMQSLFSMLFGAGLVVLGSRARDAGRSLTPIFLRRIGLLALMGILHAYLLWFGDILWTYAVCGLLIYPLRHLRTRWLLVLGVLVFLIGAASSSITGGMFWMLDYKAGLAEAKLQEGGEPPEHQREMLTVWKEIRQDFMGDAESMAKEEAAHRGGFVDVVSYRAPGAFQFQIGIPFWTFSIWRFSGYMLLGIALMRMGVFSGGLSNRAYGLMAAIGYAVGLPIVYAGLQQAKANDFDFVMSFLTGWQWNYLGSVFVAFGHIGALTLLFKSAAPVLRAVTHGLACAGRMALTNYLSQSLICAAIFFGWGLGYWNRLSRTEVMGVVLLIWALQITWSMWWLGRYRYGPMEWLWRTLSYGRQPEMRIARDT